MKRQKFSVGIDLGGTKLAAALVDQKGEILAFHKESILDLKSIKNPKQGQKKVVDLMVEMTSQFQKRFPEAFQKSKFAGVGLASAGPLNVEKGSLIHPVNFPGWKIVPIQKMLSEALKKKKLPSNVAFQNDAIAASLAEGWNGGAKGLQSYAAVTIGTGIGTGVIFNGQPCQTHGMGAEFGHLIAQNQFIKSAEDLPNHTIEGIASGTGILRRAKAEGFTGENIEELVQALEQGQSQYQALFDDAADTLAALCYNLSIGFNLEKILFSGGLIKVRHLYFDRLKARYQMLIQKMNPEFQCPLVVAKHLNQAGVLGAAYLPYLNRQK
ncbi:MAG: glucokinase [Oligoflexia bacterium]|nr:MAG: glucokinase [Oligoflexia bacterium]